MKILVPRLRGSSPKNPDPSLFKNRIRNYALNNLHTNIVENLMVLILDDNSEVGNISA